MKISRALRIFILCFVAILIIACGLFNTSGEDELSDLQNTIQALSDQLEDQAQEEEIDPSPETVFPTPTREGIIAPTLQPTEGTFDNAFELIGQYGGSSIAVAVKGQYAYLGQGPRLITLDVSNPSSPTALSRSDILPGIVHGVVVDEGYVYVTTRYSGLHVFDISQPSVPKEIGAVAPTTPGCGALVLEDDIAYIACNPSGLFIVDVSDPANPQTLSSGLISGGMFSIAFLKNHVYLADSSSASIIIFDVADPRNPQQVGVFEAAAIPSQVGVMIDAVDRCGDNLCLAVPNHGFVILDISEPANPKILGDVTQFWPSGVISDGQFAYLLDDMEGLRVFDISNPAQPQQVGIMATSVGGFEFTVHETPRGMSIADSILYVPDQAYGLIPIDIRNPAQPVRLGQYMSPVPDWMMDIQVVGETAYAVCRYGGFRILDVSDPTNMVELAYDDARKNLNLQVPSGVEVIGDYAYISDENYPFRVYDIVNPKDPVQVSAVYDHAASSGADDLAISGHYAYLSGWGLRDALYPGRGIWVIDISEPTWATPVGFVDLPNDFWSLSIQGQVLYALDGHVDNDDPEPLSLRILDISQPAQPVLVNSIAIPEFQPLFPSDLMAVGERLYIGIGYAGLKIFDIGDPFNPLEVLLPPDPVLTPYAFKMTSEGSTLFINGNMAYTIQNPDAPRMVGMAPEVLEAWTCDMEGDLVYIATKFHGIYVYRLSVTE